MLDALAAYVANCRPKQAKKLFMYLFSNRISFKKRGKMINEFKNLFTMIRFFFTWATDRPHKALA